MATDVRVIELDPVVWMRGQEEGLLLSPFGSRRHQCCIGIACTAFGVPDDDIFNIGTLSASNGELPTPLAELNAARNGNGARLISDIYCINDDEDLGDDERVESINERLEKANASFRFSLKAESR